MRRSDSRKTISVAHRLFYACLWLFSRRASRVSDSDTSSEFLPPVSKTNPEPFGPGQQVLRLGAAREADLNLAPGHSLPGYTLEFNSRVKLSRIFHEDDSSSPHQIATSSSANMEPAVGAEKSGAPPTSRSHANQNRHHLDAFDDPGKKCRKDWKCSVHLLPSFSLDGWLFKACSAAFPALKRSTAADVSYLTMSFLSCNSGMIMFSRARLSLFAIANTAAARTDHFLSEHALANAASIFGSRSFASSFAAATRTGLLWSLLTLLNSS